MRAENKTYRPKKSKTVLLALVSLVFLLIGLYMIKEEPLKGGMITAFFGICFLVFVVQLIPGSTELKLTEEGFEMTNLFRKNTTKWTDVESFQIGYLGRNKTIMFDFVEQYKKQATGKIIAKQISGNHGALPSTYGLRAAELLQILNAWKTKHS